MKKIIIAAGIVIILIVVGILLVGKEIPNESGERIRIDLPPQEPVTKEWLAFRQYVIDNNLVSEKYFDEHYRYLGLKIKRAMDNRKYTNYSSINYSFNIRDQEGKIQRVEFETAMRNGQIVPPLFMGFPTKEIETIISKSKALASAKQSGVCDSINDESDISLIWKGKVETEEGIKYKFGYAWDWQGDNGRCFIDAETGEVEYEDYMYLMN